MRLNFDREFKTLKGDPLRLNPAHKDAMTLREVVAEALVRGFPGDAPTPADALQALKLARRIMSAPMDSEVEVTAEELVEIKRVVCLGYAPLVSGQAVEMIEGETTADMATD